MIKIFIIFHLLFYNAGKDVVDKKLIGEVKKDSNPATLTESPSLMAHQIGLDFTSDNGFNGFQYLLNKFKWRMLKYQENVLVISKKLCCLSLTLHLHNESYVVQNVNHFLVEDIEVDTRKGDQHYHFNMNHFFHFCNDLFFFYRYAGHVEQTCLYCSGKHIGEQQHKIHLLQH